MATLKLYNTLGRKLETFEPLHDRWVGLYTCGPTVYAPQHLGNMRYFIFVDVLKRTLGMNGYRVKHVMNITDVGHLTSNEDTGDDKIEASAKRQHKSAVEIATEITDRFLNDLRALNIVLPDVIPYATKTIDWQIELIQKLEHKGVTYRTTDGLYFDTSKFPAYGQLSGQKASEKKAGARVEINDEKRNSTDFALWKFSKPEDKRQMEWPSPWGTGFPGWHIECSAMSMKELGEQFDIHTGGVDHIAVHHENEIAQSEAATGRHPFVKYWLHGEFLVLPGKRMGKSEGNAITLQAVIDRGLDPLAFRYLCLQTHYRKPLSFTWKSLEAANTGLRRLWTTINVHSEQQKIGCAEFEQRFSEALNDDLNTPQAVAVMHDLIASDYPWHAKRQSLAVMDKVLGLGLLGQHPNFAVTPSDEVQSLLTRREAARANKDWAAADGYRQQIEAAGYVVDDTDQGPRLRKKIDRPHKRDIQP